MRRARGEAWAWALVLAAWVALTSPLFAGPRVASINMCTDQLVLDLAEPAQIAGLSAFAADPTRSFFAERARAFPRLSGQAEDLLLLRPDVVVAGRFDRTITVDLARRRGLTLELFDFARTIAQARDQILRMGTILGRQAAATERVAALDSAVEKARQAAHGRSARVLPLERRGWSAGADTLLFDIARVVGFDHAAAGLGAGAMMRLETIVALRPDVLLVSRQAGAADDQGLAFLGHPALARAVPGARRIVVPERLTVCGGSMLIEALEIVARGLDGHQK